MDRPAPGGVGLALASLGAVVGVGSRRVVGLGSVELADALAQPPDLWAVEAVVAPGGLCEGAGRRSWYRSSSLLVVGDLLALQVGQLGEVTGGLGGK